MRVAGFVDGPMWGWEAVISGLRSGKAIEAAGMVFVSKYLASFLIAFLIVYFLTPVVRSVALRIGMMDLPDERRIHRSPIPRGGGVAIIFGFHAAYLAAIGLGWIQSSHSLGTGWWHAFLAASLVLAITGLADDYWSIPPWAKLGGQIIAGSMMFFGGCRFGTLAGLELAPVIDYGITLFWFLSITNAFNLIDGLDGLATGLALITVVGLAGALLFRRMSIDAMVLLMLAGACTAFLRYNFHPASIFLGDTGSMFLGFSLAAVSLSTQSKGTFMTAIGVPILAMGIPLFDTVLAIWRRSLRMMVPWAFPERTSPGGVMVADAEHLHHRFLRLGLKQHQVAIALYLINASLVLVGLLSMMFKAQATGIFIVAFMVASYLIFRHLAKVELWDTGRALIYGLRRPASQQVAYFCYLVGDIACLLTALVAAMVMTGFQDLGTVDRTNLLHMIPPWITPVFVCLAAFGIYRRVWSRAQVIDFFFLTLAVTTGTLSSLALVAMTGEGLSGDLIILAVLYGGGAHFLVTGTRIFSRGIREAMAQLYHSEAFSPPGEEEERVLLFGAGGRCMLFLREIGFDLFDKSRRRRVVGLIDDDPNLRRRKIYGHNILGTRKDLPRLIEKHHIHQIIITAEISDDVRENLAAISRTAGSSLTEWQYGEDIVVPLPTAPPADAQDLPEPEEPIKAPEPPEEFDTQKEEELEKMGALAVE